MIHASHHSEHFRGLWERLVNMIPISQSDVSLHGCTEFSVILLSYV